MLLCFTAAAFAQATFTVGSIPVTAVIRSGNAEKTGDITFSVVSGQSLKGTITISYGVPITSPSTINPLSAQPYITVTSSPVNLASLNSVSYSGGQVVLNVESGLNPGGTIVVKGVRVAVAGTSLTTLDANISAVSNAITAGQTTVRVINAISKGLSSIGYPKDGSAGSISAVSGTVTAGTGSTNRGTNVRITENFLAAFGLTTAAPPVGDNTQSQPPIIRLTLNALPPAKVSLTFPGTVNGLKTTDLTASGSVWQRCSGDSPYTIDATDKTINSDSTSLAVYYRLATGSDLTTSEVMDVPVKIEDVASGASYPLPIGTYTVTATFYPIAAAFNSDGTLTDLPIPRYVAEEEGPLTIMSIVGSSTAMIFPYITASKVTGYDTGIAIANTTTDPGSTPLGQSGARKQNGTITFWFYPMMKAGATAVPTPITYTTKAGSPGSGLDATGNVVSGSTYVVLASQILKDAGFTDSFEGGYMIAVANFLNAHGQYFVSNFLTFSQGGQALIVTASRRATEALNN